MRIALSVFPFATRPDEGLPRLRADLAAAAQSGCDLVAFPEACLTGLDLAGVYADDLPLALAVDSSEIGQIRDWAREFRLHVAFGWLESADDALYDSALLIDDAGGSLLHYRRISPGWRYHHADPTKYRCGESVPVAETRWGRIAILLCGDLFHPGLPENVADQNADYLIHAMARGLEVRPDVQERWDQDELPEYRKLWACTGARTLMVNGISEAIPGDEYRYWGGACLADRDGAILVGKLLGGNGLLIVEG
jgi:predicted amidohydrolase